MAQNVGNEVLIKFKNLLGSTPPDRPTSDLHLCLLQFFSSITSLHVFQIIFQCKKPHQISQVWPNKVHLKLKDLVHILGICTSRIRVILLCMQHGVMLCINGAWENVHDLCMYIQISHSFNFQLNNYDINLYRMPVCATIRVILYLDLPLFPHRRSLITSTMQCHILHMEEPEA